MSRSSVTTKAKKKSGLGNPPIKNLFDQSVRDLLCQYHAWFSLGLIEVSFIHRLGNILMSIQGNLELGREEIKQGRCAEKCFKDIELAVRAASEYASWIQQLQVQEPLNVKQVDLALCVREAIHCLNQRWNRKTKMEVSVPSKSVQVYADPLLLIVMLLELLSIPDILSVNDSKEGKEVALSLNPPKANHTPTQRSFSHVELRIDAKGFKPWSSGNLSSSDKAVAPKNHISYEMARSVMKLFKGDICISHPQQLDESVSLYFPMTYG